MVGEYYCKTAHTVQVDLRRDYGTPMPGEHRAALIAAGHLNDAERLAQIQYTEGAARAFQGRTVSACEPTDRQAGYLAGLCQLQANGADR